MGPFLIGGGGGYRTPVLLIFKKYLSYTFSLFLIRPT